MSTSAFFLGLSVAAATAAAAKEANVSLEQRVAFELTKPMSCLTDSTIEEIRSRHHVLIPGMMNGLADFFGLYYVDVKKFLDSIGANYTYLGLPTKISAVTNSEFLNGRLREIYESQMIKRPLSLTGHSKGGSEILLTILRHPDLVLDGVVDRVLLEQAAIRGTSLAAPRILSFLNFFSYFYLKDGLRSVQTSTAQKNLDEAFGAFEESLKERYKNDANLIEQKKAEISSRIRYVRTYQDPGQFSLGTKIVLWACNRSLDEDQGPSDGLLLLDDQKDNRIGADLGILKQDHVGLVISLVSNTSQEERMAMVRAVLGHFYASI